MPLRFWLRLAEILLVLVMATALFISWREVRQEHGQLTAALAEAKQALSAADTRQHDRDAQLNQTLAGLATLKKQVQTPAQLIKDISRQIPLPTPLELKPVTMPRNTKRAPGESGSAKSTSPLADFQNPPNSAKSSPLQAVIPTQDLKSVYDFALDCKACQAKLAASQGDLADERAKTAALGKERDAALKAAKGGNLWRRVTRAAKWFALGAAAGALAAKSAH